jgi:hypothetical protein
MSELDREGPARLKAGRELAQLRATRYSGPWTSGDLRPSLNTHPPDGPGSVAHSRWRADRKREPMSYVLILEFEGGTPDHYREVNKILGIDMITGKGDWPTGLLSHTGAVNANGDIAVVEVWDAQESQEAFMKSRLGTALAQAGVPKPHRMEWLKTLAHHKP